MQIRKHTLFSDNEWKVAYDWLPGGTQMDVRRCAVIHFTGGATGRSSVDFWKTPAARGACAHLVIERGGSIIQCRRFDKTAGHAGASRWQDPRPGGKEWRGLNSCSIGIELANAGADKAALAWARNQAGFAGTLRAKHPNGGPVLEWECYPDRQILSLIDLLKLLCQEYRLDDITGHDHIAPERKDDPGPAFPWERVRSACLFPGLPKVNRG